MIIKALALSKPGAGWGYWLNVPTPLEQIRALEQAHDDDQRKLNRQGAIDTALTIACRNPAAQGKTRQEVHDSHYATNRAYQALFDLEAACIELRKQIA